MTLPRRIVLTAFILFLPAAASVLLHDREWRGGRLEAAPVSGDGARVVVGRAIQVSRESGSIPHRECVVAADPTNPDHLLVAAMHQKGKRSGGTTTGGVAGYVSVDGGETWVLAFAHEGEEKVNRADPSVAFGVDGSAHFVCMRTNSKAWEGKPIRFGDPEAGGLEFSRSPDGGRTWGPLVYLPSFIDRPWLALDGTGGRFRGRLYCLYNSGATWTCLSAARGDVQGKPERVSFPKLPKTRFAETSNPVVLSDGSVVCAQDQRGPDKRHRPRTTVMRSDDGGATFGEVGRVNTDWDDPARTSEPPRPEHRTFFPQLAADPSATSSRDRLYFVWEDGGQEARILISASGDRGRTWTPPLVLSEQAAGGPGYLSFMPSVAVNRRGAIAVSWYDRRGLAPGTKGYNVRLRVSIDGGASWLPSVQLNETACRGSIASLGDTAGLAADADGAFHPVWIDDRTGKPQVWTTTVRLAPVR